MDQEQLEYYRDKLLEEKNSLLHQLKLNESFGLDESMNASIGELSGYDNHPGDLATEMYEREKDIALEENEVHLLDLVNEALERIEDGTYGYCLKCKKEIPIERLNAVPYAKYCIEHQPNDSISIQRPIEEQFLMPPFGRTSFDDKDNETEFDGEDAWQAVARFGTSNPPDYFRDGDDYDHLYIESREPRGYVEQVEGFIITDADGNPIDVTRNEAYDAYMENIEGEEGISEIHIDDLAELEDEINDKN
ncbi:hypothetical protein BHF71_02695 [Vulcanibacillus modesticaldus]|uniref:Zinc finger DksA/TraR C4-type domain-containing protein n=1 Tax=Vulcanibacillus modesticaldus TaxID=337097 RepID=A0A1D2YTT7_9BACI|nr:TraR/DksA C4-type zinc finger protein [Vulcanibacillus modesticaldus]OEF99108.1 hypothetical protein BHF71_02695 [Vulcanibacillus modesticaldus]